MSNRIYNILFHTHTVSGLVISVALYVIFFTGSLSFFRDDIIAWERDQAVARGSQMIADFDGILDSLQSRYGSLYGRDMVLRQMHRERNIMVSMEPSKDSLATDESKRNVFTYFDTKTSEEENYYSSYTLGEFFYRLHFFAQIPYPYGYLLSGFVAFFFLFANVTGVIVHWKKIISNFYQFRPWAKLKTVWTDGHTALGLIGLPFQFVFAVTGAVLIIGTTIMLAPASSLLYKNDTNKMYGELMDQPSPEAFLQEPISEMPSINSMIEHAYAYWDSAALTRVVIQNYGDANMRVILEGHPQKSSAFVGLGKVIFDNTGEVISAVELNSSPYVVGADQTIRSLHFGDFGGYGLKVIYFVFGIITCFVILSGVLIWVEARDKKINAEWKRKANKWVADTFVAMSLSLYPVSAMIFSAVKLFKDSNDPMPHLWIYKVFFLSWLALSLFFVFRRNNFFTNKYCLLSGALLGFAVPVVNGIVSGNWLWMTFATEQQIFVVDFFWLTTSVVAILTFFRLKKPQLEIRPSRKSVKTTPLRINRSEVV